jgi:ribonucleoside-triphosphate reductase
MEQAPLMDYLSFRLDDDFVRKYSRRKVNWGFPMGGGNYLGEWMFFDKYSRKKADGTKERWHETCRRVIEGMYSIQKDHCLAKQTPWNDLKAQRSAQDAFDRMFNFKWLPPGRGLWMMGTEFVNGRGNSAALQNCAFISTEKLTNHSAYEATLPFVRLMEMSMLGVGVGFDVKGAGKLTIHEPQKNQETYVIPDTREGWVESVGLLLESFFFKNRPTWVFDYSEIRPAGTPIKGFGGTAAGSGPLIRLHEMIRDQFTGRAGQKITETDIADVQNQIGVCVQAGNVRRSAEIALGPADSKEFLNLKNYEENERRMAWGWASNNSVFAEVGGNYDYIAERIADNGEPGLFWLDMCRDYGRTIDPPNKRDYRAAGTNPCSEQTLESYECCTLVETFPIRHDNLKDYLATLKVAYLYGKSVTLLPTHWPETNEVMSRNHRIGTSVTGQAQFAETHGWTEMRKWLNTGYNYIQAKDTKYSEWMGVRESIKTTSVKPSGTVSLLAGVTPGVHWPVNTIYYRRQRIVNSSVMLDVAREAGYHVEPAAEDPETTSVVTFPVRGPEVRTEAQVSMWEKMALAVLHQEWWADNQVSCTVTFSQDEKDSIPALLRAHDGKLKSISLLPIQDQETTSYAQLPYESISEEQYESAIEGVNALDWKRLYGSGEAEEADGEKYCANDTCEVPWATSEA